MDFAAMLGRVIRAIRLDVTLYQEVEVDERLTTEAAIVVILVGIIGAIGTFFATLPVGFGRAIVAFFGAAILAVIAWVVQAYLIHFIGTSLFQGQSTAQELMRTVGYAQAPGLLGIFSFIPVLGWILAIIGFIWILVGTVIAAREALDIDTGKAFVTCLLAFIAYVVLRMIFGFIF